MIHEARIRVRFAETDQMGIVYHSNYLIWMEVGRVEFFRAAGIRYRDMEANEGVLLTVAEANCRYLAPARYDDEVIVETRIRSAHSRLIEFEYTLKNADTGLKLAEGFTKHVFCGRDLRPRKLPEAYHSKFGILKR